MSIKNIIIIFFLLIFSTTSGQNYLNRDWKYYMKKGNLQFRAGMYNFALESYEKVLDRNSSAYEAANKMGALSMIKNKKQDALRWFLKSLKIKNDQSDIHYKAGSLYDFFADHDNAYKHYAESITINPDHIQSNMALVRFHHKKENYKKAAFHLEKSRAAGFVLIKKKLSAAEKLEKENMSAAIKLYREIITRAPATLKAHRNIFNLYRRSGQYKKAAQVMENLKFLVPGHEQAYVYLGHLYFNQRLPGNTRRFYLRQAIKNLKKAHELNPDNAETLHTLARIYVYIKKPLLARKTMKKAAEIEAAR